jgi:hypothetical protein
MSLTANAAEVSKARAGEIANGCCLFIRAIRMEGFANVAAGDRKLYPKETLGLAD